jgi:predicted RNase H-like nuclease (RuvC/YqgF family)
MRPARSRPQRLPSTATAGAEASIERYLSELETAINRLKDKVGRLKQEIEHMKAIEAQLAKAEEIQISLTDPDARSKQGIGKATGTIGYAGNAP